MWVSPLTLHDNRRVTGIDIIFLHRTIDPSMQMETRPRLQESVERFIVPQVMQDCRSPCEDERPNSGLMPVNALCHHSYRKETTSLDTGHAGSTTIDAMQHRHMQYPVTNFSLVVPHLCRSP